MNEQKISGDEGLAPIPQSERMSWQSIALIQAGICVCVPAFLLGALLSDEMNFWPAVLSGTLGYIIAIAVMCITGIIGSDLGVTSCVMAEGGFGKKGARYIVSTLFAINMLGWFGIQNKVTGDIIGNFLSDHMGIQVSPILLAILCGVIMLGTAVFGMKALDKLNKISIPLLMITMLLGLYLAIGQYGTEGMMTEIEPTMSFWSGVALSFNFYAVGTVTSADFTRYQKSRKDTLLSTTLGVLPMGIITLVISIILTRIANEYDISIVLMNVGIPVIGILSMILSTWTTNSTNAYAAGISSMMILGQPDRKRKFVTVVVGGIAVVLGAFGVFDSVESVLSMLAFIVCPIGGVVIADYWVIGKGKPENFKPVEGFRMTAIITWIISAILSYGLGIEYIGILVAFIIFLALEKIVNRTNTIKGALDENIN